MPGYDRTGPTGQGSRTGRALGKCRPPKRENDSQEAISEQLLNYQRSVTQNDNPTSGPIRGGRGLGQGRGRGSAENRNHQGRKQGGGRRQSN